MIHVGQNFCTSLSDLRPHSGCCPVLATGESAAVQDLSKLGRDLNHAGGHGRWHFLTAADRNHIVILVLYNINQHNTTSYSF